MSNSCKYLLLLFFLWFFTNGTADSTTMVDIGVVVDLGSIDGTIANICLSMGLSDFYSQHSNYRTRLSLHIRNATGILGVASTALDLLNNIGVHAIIGPQRPAEAAFVIELGEKTHVPIISFSATIPYQSLSKYPYFIRTAQIDSLQVKSIIDILQRFGWHEIVLIHEDTDYGNGIVPSLTDALQDVDIRVSNKSSIHTTAKNAEILKELKRLNNKWTRVFLVHMTSCDLGSRLFVLADQAGMMSKGYAWIITDGLSSCLDSVNATAIDSMEGVIGIRRHVPESRHRENFELRWKRNQIIAATISTGPNIFGLWAYDTIWALAMAVERIQSINSTFLKLNNTDNLTDFPNIGISEIGPKLLKEMANTKFRGLSGEFNLVNGQLQSSALEIFNVLGKGVERVIGYWSPEKGISRKLGHNINLTESTSMNELKQIIWPGDSTTTPNVMKIGVPYKAGFPEFVDVTTDNTIFKGFSIDFFLLVRANLTNKYDYRFETFTNETGDSAGTYDDLVCSHEERRYDLVVGDITILANRTKCADFTLPYSDTGVAMLIPVKHDWHRAMWGFLKPLSWDLWLTILMTCIFIGLALKFLERNANSTEFSGSPKQQIGMIFWFPFQAMVIPQREMVVNTWSRIVLVVWLFLAFVLMQSYTASLSSRLTVDQLKPSYPSVKSLKDKGLSVGFQTDSFIEDFLVNELKFDEKNVKPYGNISEYYKALSTGEVAAIIDEIPYIKLYLNKYGNSKYAKAVPLPYSTHGFGFAFRKGSPLVADFSRAILEVIDGKNKTRLEELYFGSQIEDDQISSDSPSLSTSSFAGLFIVTGATTLLVLIASESYVGQRLMLRLMQSIQRYIFFQPSDEPSQPSNGIESSQPPDSIELSSQSSSFTILSTSDGTESHP